MDSPLYILDVPRSKGHLLTMIMSIGGTIIQPDDSAVNTGYNSHYNTKMVYLSHIS